MRYADASAFRMALEARLNARSRDRDQHRGLDRMRKIIAFERFLARFILEAPKGWVVKGGLALEFRYGDQARATHDLDIATLPEDSDIESLFLRAVLLEMGDFFSFRMTTVRIMDIDDTPGVHRFNILCMLADRRFESLVIDVGSNQFASPEPEPITVTDLLDFAGFEPIVVPALPLEIHVAEKLHAYTREYGEGRQSTRVKDLIDLVLIPSLSPFESMSLRAAIDETFGSRQTQTIPAQFPPPGEHWRIPYASLAREVGLPDSLDDGFHAAAAFLDPVLASIEPGPWNWDPAVFAWIDR